MAIEFNEKGKFFTDIVSKDAVQAVIQTLTHRLEGYVYVRQGQRLKDELDDIKQFIAVTDARVYDARGQLIYRTDFIVVNREHVVWLIPHDDLNPSEN